ncbi:MAG TPA: signal peptidase I, partial [Caulobacteraceae bacterium]|nr:signal peptidase I [Caulobacteraceae bacterium]
NLFRGDYIIVTKWSYGWSQKSIPFLDLMQPIVHGRLFFQKPRRGDIVVFALPHDGHTNFIKRLIGLPGDRVQMKAGRLYINGQELPEQPAPLPTPPRGITFDGARGQLETNPEGRKYLTQIYANGDTGEPLPNANNTIEYVVPPHCYFMMGDNRDDSLDSRFEPELPEGDPKLGGCGLNNGLPSSIDNPGVGFVPEENLIGKAQLVLISWDTGESDQDNDKASLFKPWTWFTDVRLGRMFKVLR